MSALEEPVAMEWVDHRFGAEPGFPLGVEDELLLVEPDGKRLRAEAERVIADARPVDGWLSSEIFAAELELVTPVCHTVDEAAASLGSLLSELRRVGAVAIGAGLHPAAAPGHARLCTAPRYAAVSDALQGLLRTPPAALHIHVGMPDPETAIRASNGLRRHLPMLHALAANSPFWYGRDSGLASARTAVLRSYPRYGVPRWFRNWEDFTLVAQELAQAAGVPDYTYFWWDVRPHPRLGTVEVRAPDAQFSLERTLAIAAFVHALARMEAEGSAPPHQSRDAIEEACYQATRYGLEARLPDDAGRLRPTRLLVRELLLRVMPYARELGADAYLVGIERILWSGNGAEIQRAIHRERGMSGLLEWLIQQRRP